MASEMTYDSLVQDIERYADRTDEPFLSQIPRFIALAENRIATEIHALGYRRFVTGNLTSGEPFLEKPGTWRETISFSIGIGTGNATRKYLRNRGFEYLRVYWPNATLTGEPRFYSDADFDRYLIAPTPDANYPFELVYHERPFPLSEENQQNWTTKHAPQLILYATLLEAQPFLMRPERTQEFQALFDRASAAIMNEDRRRLLDDTVSRKDKV